MDKTKVAEEIETKKRLMIGIVISDRMDKTVTVEVERTYKHPRLQKIVRTVKKYKVHDGQNEARVGDTIEFYEGRPISKTKYAYLYRVMDNKGVQGQ